MLKKTKDINKVQLFFLMITVGTVFKIIYLPILLVEVAGKDSWITVCLMWIVELIIAGIIFFVYNIHKEKTFSTILEQTISKAGRIIVMLLFGAFLTFKTLFIFSMTLKFMMSNLYNNLPWNPFVLPLLIFLLFAVFKGLRAITRANELFGCIILVVIILSVVIFLINADFPTILPVAEFGFGKPLGGLNQYILAAGDYLVCFLFLGRIKTEKGTNKAYWFGIIVTMILTLAFSLAFYTFYNNIAAFQHHGHMMSDMAKSFRDSDSLARIDTIIIIFWSIIGIFHLILHFWASKQCFADAFKLNDSVKNKMLCTLPLVLPILYISAVMFISTPVTPEIYSDWYRWIFAVPGIFILPVLALVSAIILKHKEKKNGIIPEENQSGGEQDDAVNSGNRPADGLENEHMEKNVELSP